jgi:hypothetical protein
MYKEAIEKILDKALSNGFDWSMVWSSLKDKKYHIVILDGDSDLAFYSNDFHPNPWIMSLDTLFFNHDFAKALWGDKEFTVFHLVNLDNDGTTSTETMKRYEYHLQRMAIATHRIKYIQENT